MTTPQPTPQPIVSDPQENLIFSYHTIRLIIGLIAVSFPLIIFVRATYVTPSVSWSYYTNARDDFVGLLFVLGGFLMSYTGHKPILTEENVGKFWKWMSNFWKGAINFRITERKNEENLVGWVGGVAAWMTSLSPTAQCYK